VIIMKKIALFYFIVLLLLQGCAIDFTATIPTIGVQPTVAQPFKLVELETKINMQLDPFYYGDLPGGMSYKDSVYETMDGEIESCYKEYGYDLADIAMNIEDNPMTENQFSHCLADKPTYENPAADTPTHYDTISSTDWLRQVLTGAVNPAHRRFLEEINDDPQNKELGIYIDLNNSMNYERNYINALMQAHEKYVEQAAHNYFRELLELYGDADGALEYIEKYELFEEMMKPIPE
jgi:hypothetical protein